MRTSTERALRPATSPRDVLHRIAWAAAFDPALRRAAMEVLNELEAAEAQVALLKLEAACKAASSAEQVELEIKQKPFLATVEEGEEGETIVVKSRHWNGARIVEDERMPEGVILGLVSNG